MLPRFLFTGALNANGMRNMKAGTAMNLKVNTVRNILFSVPIGCVSALLIWGRIVSPLPNFIAILTRQSAA